MINRVLIRIKVVQMLYSYLLSRSEFKIESAPESPSRDKRYAYTLYLDLLLLIMELSGYTLPGSKPLGVPENRHLASNRLARALNSDAEIRRILRTSPDIASFDPALAVLYTAIVNSSAYRSYTHAKDRDLRDDVTFWITILRTVVMKNAAFIEAARKNPDFTMVGFDNGIEMAVNTLNDYCDDRTLLSEARNSLDRSLNKAYELYHAMLLLCVEITRMQDQRLDAAKHKFLPTPEELNPDTRFIDNRLPELIAKSKGMEEYLKENPVSWADDTVLLRQLLDKILASDFYRDYMAKPAVTFADDCELWRLIYKNIILPSDELAEALESKSVYWNDDLPIMGTFVMKTLKRIASSEGKEVKLLPQYKDEEDARFGADLFMAAVDNREEYRSYIDRFLRNEAWDSDRLAFMDAVIMIAAIAELLHFPSIPVPVTLNEYIEIANAYSTPRSGQFINGILYSIISHLRSEGLLTKE